MYLESNKVHKKIVATIARKKIVNNGLTISINMFKITFVLYFNFFLGQVNSRIKYNPGFYKFLSSEITVILSYLPKLKFNTSVDVSCNSICLILQREKLNWQFSIRIISRIRLLLLKMHSLVLGWIKFRCVNNKLNLYPCSMRWKINYWILSSMSEAAFFMYTKSGIYFEVWFHFKYETKLYFQHPK